MASRVAGARTPSGSTSHTLPAGTSSHDSHVPHGVSPPEQLRLVPSRIRRASMIWPVWSKRIMLTPPVASCSQFDT
jgi:hypothetical protein